MTPAHALYLAVALLTHGAVGYALARTTGTPTAAGLRGGVLPDVDLLFGRRLFFPFVHRGLLHTPLFVAGAALVAYWWSGERGTAAAVLVGGLSHLVIDSFTASGIMWLYPLDDRAVGAALGAHGPLPTVVLWAGALLAVAWTRWR
ncbi:MAG: metal-dependent hydrolase [Haloarculaceae archaeon]